MSRNPHFTICGFSISKIRASGVSRKSFRFFCSQVDHAFVSGHSFHITSTYGIHILATRLPSISILISEPLIPGCGGIAYCQSYQKDTCNSCGCSNPAVGLNHDGYFRLITYGQTHTSQACGSSCSLSR